MVSLKPLNPLPRCHWDRRICSCSLVETPEPKFFRQSFVLKTTFLGKNYVFGSFFKGFSGLIETVESASAVSMKPPNPLFGLIETAESASAVSLKPPNPFLRSHWNCGSRAFQMNRLHLEIYCTLPLQFLKLLVFSERLVNKIVTSVLAEMIQTTEVWDTVGSCMYTVPKKIEHYRIYSGVSRG
jgi:hypothetical protein